MSQYSPGAEALLAQWSCMSLNMRSAILRSRYLQQRAQETGQQQRLDDQLHTRRVNALYRRIGQELRAFSAADGVEKQFPEDAEMGPMGMGRFVDFRISEEAIPALRQRLEKVNDMVLALLLTLCTIRL